MRNRRLGCLLNKETGSIIRFCSRLEANSFLSPGVDPEVGRSIKCDSTLI